MFASSETHLNMFSAVLPNALYISTHVTWKPGSLFGGCWAKRHNQAKEREKEGMVTWIKWGEPWGSFPRQCLPEQPSWGSFKLRYVHIHEFGFPGGSAGKESSCNVGNLGSISGLGRSPGEGKGTPVFWPGEFHGLCSPQACKEWDTAEQLSLHMHICDGAWAEENSTLHWGEGQQSPSFSLSKPWSLRINIIILSRSLQGDGVRVVRGGGGGP